MSGKKTLLWKQVISVSCAVLVLLLLFTNGGPAQAAPSVRIVSAPSVAAAGETIEVVVKISKPRDVAITGYLKSYITAKQEHVGGFVGSESYKESVALNEEGWGYQGPSNKIFVSMGEGVTEREYTLTNKIMEDCPTVQASLKARLFNVSTGGGAVDKITKYDYKQDIVIQAAMRGIELPIEVKIAVGVITIAAVFASVAIIARKRAPAELPLPMSTV